MIKKGIVILMNLIVLGNANAQNTSAREKVVPILNETVDFLNIYTAKLIADARRYDNYYKRNIRGKKPAVDRLSSFFSGSIRFSIKQDKLEQLKDQLAELEVPLQNEIIAHIDEIATLYLKEKEVATKIQTLTKPQPKESTIYKEVHSELKELEKFTIQSHVLLDEIDVILYKIADLLPVDKQNPWNTTGSEMSRIIDLVTHHYEGVKSKVLEIENTNPKITIVDIKQAITEFENTREQHLKHFKEYPNNGADPYFSYDFFIKYVNEYVEDIIAIQAGKQIRHNLYNNLSYTYNHIITHYNKFAELSQFDDHQKLEKAFLLKRTKRKGIFKMQTFEIEKNANKILPNDSMRGYAYNHLILVLDVSGSMTHKDKLPLFKEALEQVSTIMRQEDVYSVIVYSDDAKLIFKNTTFTDKVALQTLKTLESKGKTNVNKGIKKAYKVLSEIFNPSYNNRILMITDGDFEVNDKTLKIITQHQDRISFSVFAVGNKAKNLSKIKELTVLGKGNYKKNHYR